MLAQQLEFGLQVMVKLDFFPVFFRMAGLAFFAVLPLMLVDLEMTSHTFMRRSFIVARVSMAFVAFHIYVLASENKTSFFETVIEFCFFPITLVMAVFTISAQTTLVFINLTMTVIAC